MASVFPGSTDTFKTIPSPTTTPTNLSDASDDTLSTRLQQHSDSIVAVQNYLFSIVASMEVTGVVKAYAGSAAPTGYLLCNGQAVSRTTFSGLFVVISTTYGIGDGSTTFNVPNLAGSVPVGVGTAPGGSTARVLAVAGGEENHALITTELAIHNHTQNAHAHAITDPGHTHSYSGSQANPSGVTVGGATFYINAVATTGLSPTGISINPSTGTNNSAGNGTGHNNMQPFLVFQYIIKF